MTDDYARPEWDEARAASLVGKVVLVGMTYAEGHQRQGEQEQFFGVVAETDPQRGVLLELSGSRAGERRWLPPHVQNFFEADPGDYRLRSTGEVVSDPDFVSTWTITRNASDSQP